MGFLFYFLFVLCYLNYTLSVDELLHLVNNIYQYARRNVLGF